MKTLALILLLATPAFALECEPGSHVETRDGVDVCVFDAYEGPVNEFDLNATGKCRLLFGRCVGSACTSATPVDGKCSVEAPAPPQPPSPQPPLPLPSPSPSPSPTPSPQPPPCPDANDPAFNKMLDGAGNCTFQARTVPAVHVNIPYNILYKLVYKVVCDVAIEEGFMPKGCKE